MRRIDPRTQPRMGRRWTVYLGWGMSLWLAVLAVFSVWRGLVLWNLRGLLLEVGSRLSAAAITVIVVVSGLCGLGLVTAAWGLFRRREWGRLAARVFVVAYFAVVQAYVWLFARTGLLWARRWVLLALAVMGLVVGVGGLTWRRSRQWLGLF